MYPKYVDGRTDGQTNGRTERGQTLTLDIDILCYTHATIYR